MRRMYLLVDNEWTKRTPEPNGNYGNTMRQVFRFARFTAQTQALLDNAIRGYLAQPDPMPLLVWTRLAVRDARPEVFERLYLVVRDLPIFNRDRFEGQPRAYVQRGRLWEVDVNGVNLQRTILDHSILLFDAAYMNRPKIARVLLRHFDYNHVSMDVAFYLALMGVLNVVSPDQKTIIQGRKHNFASAKLFFVNGADVNSMNHAAMFGAIRRDDTNMMYFLYYFGDTLLKSQSREAMLYAWQYSRQKAMEFIMSKIHHNRMSNLLWLQVNSNIYREISALNERILDNIKSQNLESLDLPWTALHVRGVARFHGRGTNHRRRLSSSEQFDGAGQSSGGGVGASGSRGAGGAGGTGRGIGGTGRGLSSSSSAAAGAAAARGISCQAASAPWLVQFARDHGKKLLCIAGSLAMVPLLATAVATRRTATMDADPTTSRTTTRRRGEPRNFGDGSDDRRFE